MLKVKHNGRLDMYDDDNSLCEICIANGDPPPRDGDSVIDMYWINTHCQDLRRNRIARENKNVVPKDTVF